jgi:hypothetical protein
VNINRNFLEGGGNISLVNVGGVVTISGNVVNGANFSGINYSATGATVAALNISGNTVGPLATFAGPIGIAVRTSDASQVRAVIIGNSVAPLRGEITTDLLMVASGGSRLTAQVALNQFGGGLALIQAQDAAFVGLQLVRNTNVHFQFTRLGGGPVFQVEVGPNANTAGATTVGGFQTVPEGTFGFTIP